VEEREGRGNIVGGRQSEKTGGGGGKGDTGCRKFVFKGGSRPEGREATPSLSRPIDDVTPSKRPCPDGPPSASSNQIKTRIINPYSTRVGRRRMPWSHNHRMFHARVIRFPFVDLKDCPSPGATAQ